MQEQSSGLQYETIDLAVAGQRVSLAVQRRPGFGAPLLSLHGFGSTKEDYADLALHPAFAGRDLIAFDAPGCGASRIDAPEALSISFLASVAVAACDALGLERFHLTGHSMGGLTALLLAHEHSERVLSFFNIEGNVAPEDCFLSRQIVAHGASDDDAFLDGFAARLRRRRESGSALYAAALPAKVRSETPRPIFTSMVALSDAAPLMRMFTGLGAPRAFVYGDQNRHLSYLDDLKNRAVEVIEIPHSGHFPMYSNPPALWDELARFFKRHEAAG